MIQDRTSRLFKALSLPLRGGEFLFWVLLLLIFSLNLASGTWVMVAFIAGLLGAICLVMYDLRLVAILWFAGSPTFFVFANNILDALPFITVERAIFFGLSLLTILGFAFRKRKGVPLDSVEKLMLVFLGIVLASMLRNFMFGKIFTIKQDIAFYVQGYLMPIMSYWLMRRLNWTEKWVARFLWVIALTSVILGLQGVMQTFLGMDFFMPTWVEIINQGRATGVFSNATEYGIACLIALLFSLLLQTRSSDGVQWVFLLFLAGAAAVGLGLSQTRAPWLAAIICLAILFKNDPKQRPLLATGGILGVIALMVAIPFVIDSDLFQRRILDPQPIYARVALFASGFRMLIDYPVLGIGFGKDTFKLLKADYLTTFLGISYDAGQRTGPPHNEWLGIMTMTGIFGLASYVSFHVLLWRKLLAVRRDLSLPPFQRLVALYAFAIFISQIIISFFIDIGYLLFTTSATFGFIGLAVGPWGDTREAPHQD